jgi:hypothetical protein
VIQAFSLKFYTKDKMRKDAKDEGVEKQKKNCPGKERESKGSLFSVCRFK